jgi:hypothetical protein
VLDWSFDLLDTDEREAFARLGVFAGSFTLADVRQLLGDHDVSLVPSLVERSLVIRTPGAVPTRFELLETMRAFARRKRGAARDGDDEAYVRWVLRELTESVERLHGPDEAEHSRRIRQQMPGARHAYHWFIAHHDDAARVRLVSALVVWGWQTDHSEVMPWAFDTNAAVDTPDPDISTAAAAAAAIAGSLTLDLETAELNAERAVASAAGASPAFAALAHYAAAEVSLFRGKGAVAASHGAAAYRLAAGTAPSLEFFGAIDAALGHFYAGDGHEADRWVDIAEGLARRLGGANSPGWVDYVHGERCEASDPVRAVEHLTRCLERIDPVEHSFLAGVAGLGRVTAAVRSGDDTEVHGAFAALFDRWQRGGSKVQLLTGLRDVVTLMADAGRFRDAAVLLGAILHASPDPHVHLEVVETHYRAIEAGLSADAMQQATAEGDALTLDGAVELALQFVARSKDA